MRSARASAARVWAAFGGRKYVTVKYIATSLKRPCRCPGSRDRHRSGTGTGTGTWRVNTSCPIGKLRIEGFYEPIDPASPQGILLAPIALWETLSLVGRCLLARTGTGTGTGTGKPVPVSGSW